MLAAHGVSQVEDYQDGTYQCTYVTSVAGMYKISVTLNGRGRILMHSIERGRCGGEGRGSRTGKWSECKI
jgi:hypothetical protein